MNTAMILPASLRLRLKRYLFEGDMLRLMGLTLLIKPVGLVTQMLTASHFGAGAQYDAYALTFFLVSFLDNLVGQGYNTVVLPLAIQMRAGRPREDVLRFQNLAALLFLVPVILYLVVLLGRPEWILALVAPGLPDEARHWVGRFVPWMALPGMALMVVTMGKSVLNANRRFSVAGAMPLVGGLVILAVLWLGAPRAGIWALVGGYLLAAAVQVAVVFGFSLRTGCVGLVRPAAPAADLRQLWSLGWVVFVTQGVLICGMAADRYFATGLEVGSVSSLAYTSSIINMGTQLFSMSVTVVMFTRMSEMIAARDMSRCSDYIRDNLGRQMRLVVPGSLALCLAAPEIVRVLFQRGAFSAEDAARTTGVLAVYVLALPAMVANSLVARIYHSLQRMRDRIWLGIQYVATIVACNLALVPVLRVQGIAVSATLAINLHLALSFFVLSRYRDGLRVRRFAAVMTRAYACGALVYGFYRLVGFRDAFGSHVAGTGVAAAAGVAVVKALFVFAAYFGFHLAWGRLLRRARSAA